MALVRSGWPRRGLVATLVLAPLIATGCGSSGGSSSGASTTAATSSAAGGNAAVTAADAAVQTAYTGTDRALPTAAPAPTKKNLWIVSCSQGAPGCATPSNAMKAAAEAIGWDATIADGKLDFSTYSTLIRQAIAAKASAIALVAIDCSSVKQPLQEAKSAGIIIYGVLGFDCDDPSVGGTKLFTANLGLGGVDNPLSSYLESLGAVSADYLISKTQGKADAVEVYEDDVLYDKYVGQGFETAMKACGTCTVTRATITSADYGASAIQSKTSAVIARRPNVNTVMTPVDALVTLGAGQAAKSASNKVILTGVGGLQPNVVQIAGSGPQSFAAGLPFARLGWAAVDELNRLFAGQPQVDEGIGTQAIDATHNLPKDPAYYDGNVDSTGAPKVDYETTYKKLWGIS